MNQTGTRPRTLIEKLTARIKQSGPISVADFMVAALGDPKFGYYTTRQAIGREGDFITAPEVSQMFGELIGLWAAQVWLSMDAPADIALVELGPGRGTLMSDMMRTIARSLPDFHASLDVHLVELSPRLRAEQASALEGKTASPVTWHDTIDTLPDTPTLIIANEFFDALPICQFVQSGDGWHERRVGLGAGGDAAFGFCLAEELTSEPGLLPQDCSRPVPVETIAEIRPEAIAIIQKLGGRLRQTGGAALLIDYGYKKSSFGNTFQAVKNHKPWHVLYHPGEADLTAHVDFAELQRAATAADLSVSNVIEQGSFLKALGIETRAAKLTETATPAQAADIASALERLTNDARMGSLFKALAVYSKGLPLPPGFEPEQETEQP